MKKEKTIQKCQRCSKEMEYGKSETFECVEQDGSKHDYCEDCFSEYTTDTENIENLIIG